MRAWVVVLKLFQHFDWLIFRFSACAKFSTARNIFSVNTGPCKIYDEREEEINEYLSFSWGLCQFTWTWMAQSENSKKLPNFSQLLCTKGRKWRSKKGESVCLRCMSQFLLDQHDHVSTGKCPTMMLLNFRWRQVSFQWKVMANGKFPLSSALADKFGKYAINFESLHNVNTIHV